MTEENHSEVSEKERLAQLERSLTLINACNKAIIQADHEQALLEQICRIMVEDGGYLLAWIGEAMPEPGKKIIPRASFGFEEGYLEVLDLTWQDTERGRGPSGTAVRTRKPVACQNILEDDQFLPWREDALKRGYCSALSLPLLVEDDVYGTLNIYSPASDAFDWQEIEILDKMAENLGYGIRNLHLARERNLAQHAVVASERRYRSLFNSTGDAIFVVDPEGGILEANDAVCLRLGYCHSDLQQIDSADLDLGGDLNLELVRKELAVKNSVEFESRFRERSGRSFPAEIIASTVYYEGIPAFLCVVRDISRQKKAEQELRESKEMFAEYIDQLQAVAFVKDHGSRLLYANRKMKEVLGAWDWLGKKPHEYLPGQMADWVLEEDRKALETGFVDEEGIIPDSSGVNRIWRIVKFSIYRTDKPPLLGGILTDITEQKQLEENLKNSEERYRRLFEDSILGIFRTTAEGRVLEVNPAYAAMMGYDSPEEVCRTVRNLAEDHYVNAFDREWMVDLALKEDRAVVMETCYRRKDGSEFSGMLHAWAVRDGLGNLLYLEGFVEDITERRKALNALEESERRFRLLAENARDMIYRMSLSDGRYEYVSPACKEMFGLSPEEFYARPLLIKDIIAPEYREYFEREWTRLLQGELDPTYEYQVVLPTGERRWLSQRNHLVRNTEGKPEALEGIVSDITESKETELLIRKQFKRTELLNRIILTASELQDLGAVFEAVLTRIEEQFDLAFSAIIIFDTDERILRVKAAHFSSAERKNIFPAHLTFPPDLEQMLQMECSAEKLRNLCAQPIREVLHKAGKQDEEILPMVAESEFIGFLVMVPTSSAFSERTHNFLVQLANHLALVSRGKILFQKLQEAYQQMQEDQKAMLKQERIRALGQMASGIVHDINNAMSPVMGYTNLLLEDDTIRSDKARDYLENILISARDVTHIVSQMREFYRERSERDEQFWVDLNTIVSQTLDLTRPKWRDQPQEEGRLVIVDTELDDDIPLVFGSESELREALTNLILNAVDALGAEGVVLIQTFMRNDLVVLAIRDNGRGMDEETRKQCLEPFFTTKGQKGTGMGLAMVYGIMQRHQGEVTVDSEVGRGTTIELTFPVKTGGEPAVSRLQTEMKPRVRKILCIDDELPIRTILKEMLCGDGHLVEVAENGADGLEMFRGAFEAGDPFDLVITDLGMPFMDGRDVVEALKRDFPEVPVILLTGWGGRLGEETRVPENVDIVLSKPPELGSLRRALNEVDEKKHLFNN